MIESHQLGWRAQSTGLDGKQAELHAPPLDDPQFASLLLRLEPASDVHGLLNIFRSILNEVAANGFPAEQIALLRRLHSHIEITQQRLSAREERAAERSTRNEFAKIIMRSSLHERFSRLTPAERELVELLWEGASNKEIAAQLGKSIRTVKSQFTSVYKKFGVKSRTRLLALMR